MSPANYIRRLHSEQSRNRSYLIHDSTEFERFLWISVSPCLCGDKSVSIHHRDPQRRSVCQFVDRLVFLDKSSDPRSHTKQHEPENTFGASQV